MKYFLLIICLYFSQLFAQNSDLAPRDLTGLRHLDQVPDLFNGIYDQYAKNYYNAAMTGRGNTGIAEKDRINVATYNPAAYRSDKIHFSFEFTFKSEINEFNTENYYEHYNTNGELYKIETKPSVNMYKSPYPFTYLGIGFPATQGINYGVSYALNRSIQYDAFRRYRVDDVYWNKYPSFYEHYITLTVNKVLDNLTVGMNNILLIQDFSFYKTEGRNNDVSFTEFLYRPQLGLLYDFSWLSVGASYKPKMEYSIGSSFVDFDAVYPTHIQAGLAFSISQYIKPLFDIEYERFSETSKELDDRLTYKIGVELIDKVATLRAGYIFSPSIFEGEYRIKNYYEENAIPEVHLSQLNRVPLTGKFKNTDLHLLTIGTTFELPSATRFHLALVTDLTSHIERTQLMLNIEFNGETFKTSKK